MNDRQTFDWRDAVTVLWIIVVLGANLWMMAQFLVQLP